MKAIAVRRETATPEALVDRVMCHDVRDPGRRVVVPKGARIDATVATTLLGVPWDEIHVLALDPGDVHEEEAGERLAALRSWPPSTLAAVILAASILTTLTRWLAPIKPAGAP
jgi:hypothetical protein